MRLGVILPAGGETELAVAAEASGLGFVYVTGDEGTEAAIAAMVVTATSSIRVIVGVHLGNEHPVTIAEELAVLDNIGNGRTGVIAEVGSLDVDAATEDVALIQASLSGRAVSHRGTRWRVPAGIAGHIAPDAVMVTPPPAQLELPLWVAGDAAESVARSLAVPFVAATPADVDASSPVAPGRTVLNGDLDNDRQAVIEWSDAGTTHLLCALEGTATVDAIARWLVPEVAMVGFPRAVTETPLPAPWPGRSAQPRER